MYIKFYFCFGIGVKTSTRFYIFVNLIASLTILAICLVILIESTDKCSVEICLVILNLPITEVKMRLTLNHFLCSLLGLVTLLVFCGEALVCTDFSGCYAIDDNILKNEHLTERDGQLQSLKTNVGGMLYIHHYLGNHCILHRC